MLSESASLDDAPRPSAIRAAKPIPRVASGASTGSALASEADDETSSSGLSNGSGTSVSSVASRKRTDSRTMACLVVVVLACRKVFNRIHRLALVTYLKVQLRAIGVRSAQFGDFLAPFDLLLLLHDDLAVVRVSSDELVGMADDHEVAVAPYRAADVNDLAISRRQYRGPFVAGDVDALVAGTVKALDDLAGRRPLPLQTAVGRPGRLNRLGRRSRSYRRRRRC